MTEVQQSPEVIAIAHRLGVDIDSSVTFNPKTAVLKVAQQLEGKEVAFSGEDAEFGGFFGKILKRVTPKRVVPSGIDLSKARIKVDIKKSATGLTKATGKLAAVASFAVPGLGPLVGGTALAAMTAADKVLSSGKAAGLVSNTKALAALGNVPARRGAAVLGAVAQIRQVKGVAPGQPVFNRPVQTAAYVQNVPRAQVKALAVNVVATAPAGRSFWQKLKDLFR